MSITTTITNKNLATPYIILKQGVTYTTKDNSSSYSKDYIFTIPENYKNLGTSNNVQFCKNDTSRVYDSSYWQPFSSKGYGHSLDLTLGLPISVVDSVTPTNGSLDVTFVDSQNEPLFSFEAIPGDLDTSLLANGDYAFIAIPVIFNQLKNFIFGDSIFVNIQNNLAAFFASIALEQRIVSRIQKLNDELTLGKITIDEFQEGVQQSETEFASEYGANYTSNYVKLAQAIEENKPLLQI
jgi:hypothetical protein